MLEICDVLKKLPTGCDIHMVRQRSATTQIYGRGTVSPDDAPHVHLLLQIPVKIYLESTGVGAPLGREGSGHGPTPVPLRR